MWNKDELKGKAKQVIGKTKRKMGKATGDRELESEGNAERVEGKVQEKFGEVRRKVGKTLEEGAKAISGKR